MAARKQTSAKDMNSLKIINLGIPTAAADATTKTYVDTGDTSAKARANHTGTQLAATISDFDAQVRTSRLDQMATPTASVGLGNQKIINLLDPTAAQDAATKAYVDGQITGLTTGLTLKGTVRVASTVNVTVSAPGANVDGLAMSNGDIVLLTAQTTAAENGPYVFNGAAAAMTRATNFDTGAEAVLGSFWIVREGSKADQFAIMSNDTAITVGTTAMTFIFVTTGGGTTSFSQDVGAITAGGSATITHNLGTRDVSVTVYRNSTPWDDVDVYIDRPTVNTITIQPDVAYAAAEYRVKVSKA